VEAKRTVELAPPAEAQARYFRVLGDPNRLRILEALIERERSVSELVSALGAPRSRVSNHLACLKWCHFVEAERQGRKVLYRVTDPRVGELLAIATTISPEHCDRLAGCRRIGPDWI
jgi:DNA-binding transcriptional ArsR family regulator